MAKKNAKKSDSEKPQNGSNGASYTAKDIYVLEGLEPVRKRPGMYIGSTGVDGLHHLVWEVVDNSLDEAMGGYAKNIEISLLPDNQVSVRDDGRGIPVEKHKQTGVSALETVMTTLHAGGKFGGESYKVAAGLHGVGVSVVNALSTYLKAEVCRDGDLYVQEYNRGEALKPVRKVGKCGQTGTTVIFEPDPEIFKDRSFDWERILTHLRQQAYLTKGVRIVVNDLRSPLKTEGASKGGELGESIINPSYTFYFEGGVVSYVDFLSDRQEAKHSNIFYTSKEYESILVEVALRYTNDIEEHELSFANNVHTTEGGMHLTGFRSAITRTLNDYARKNGYLKEKDENFSGEDVREGLVVVVSVKLREPQFEGQTKAKLGTPDARTAVETVINTELADWLDRNPTDAQEIMAKVILASKARIAAKAARETVIRKGALEGFTLPGKLADCSSKNPEDSELFIVEGESAGGSSKQGRDRRTQAILPLKGKILNVEKSRIDKMLASEEIRALIIALGTAIAEEFDESKLRYHKVVIMTDADVDGAHIRTLLLTLFFRYFKDLIEKGRIFIAQPPLYRIQKGNQINYAYSEEERVKVVNQIRAISEQKSEEKAKTKQLQKQKANSDWEVSAIGGDNGQVVNPEGSGEDLKITGLNIQRYKGLGEMNPDQLWETTMNPQNRVLLQVTMEDAEKADKTFDVLMGSDVLPRKKFIQTHAKNVKNLDV
jgi:DNA gyrase subunit B